MGHGRPLLRGWLHGAAVPFAVAGSGLLWRAVGHLSPLARLPALLYGLAVVMLFSVSAVYHIPRWWSPAARARLLRMDGAATVLLISGTFVPVAAYTLDGAWRSRSLAGALLLTGVGVRLAATRVATPPRLAAIGYVLAGWLAAIPIWRIALVLPRPGIALIVLGGVVYSLGAAVYALRRPDPSSAWFGYHEVFHVLVTVAAGLHFTAIWFHVLPLAD